MNRTNHPYRRPRPKGPKRCQGCLPWFGSCGLTALGVASLCCVSLLQSHASKSAVARLPDVIPRDDAAVDNRELRELHELLERLEAERVRLDKELRRLNDNAASPALPLQADFAAAVAEAWRQSGSGALPSVVAKEPSEVAADPTEVAAEPPHHVAHQPEKPVNADPVVAWLAPGFARGEDSKDGGLAVGSRGGKSSGGGGAEESVAAAQPPPPPPPLAPPSWGGNVAAPGAGSPDSLPGAPLFKEGAPRRVLAADPLLIREAIPLIVGGTDGSGTRGVVALLQRLGVPMVIEDNGTLDVHADYMARGGWPGAVRPVLERTRSTAYDTKKLDPALRTQTIKSIGILADRMAKAKLKLKPTITSADHVSFGFKAPVSMLLLPFFVEAWGCVRFIHVVRDGRDLAFSGNQTPVEKFYEATFPGGSAQWTEKSMMPAKAVQLWDRWNGDLYEWAVAQRDGRRLDYLLLHTEDLIDTDAKFAAVKDVAEFVGSHLSDHDLCCLAMETARDMGSHTKDRREKSAKVTDRFGKWRGKVEGNERLERALHEMGGRGLRLFGYEPERVLRSPGPGEYVCDKMPENCPKPPPLRPPPRAGIPKGGLASRTAIGMPKTVQDTETCKGVTIGKDYKGADVYYGPAKSHLECCDMCHNEPRCTHFTMDFKSRQCYLKDGPGKEGTRDDLVSGTVSRK